MKTAWAGRAAGRQAALEGPFLQEGDLQAETPAGSGAGLSRATAGDPTPVWLGPSLTCHPWPPPTQQPPDADVGAGPVNSVSCRH